MSGPSFLNQIMKVGGGSSLCAILFRLEDKQCIYISRLMLLEAVKVNISYTSQKLVGTNINLLSDKEKTTHWGPKLHISKILVTLC